jgi:hypothetical protein
LEISCTRTELAAQTNILSMPIAPPDAAELGHPPSVEE